uniref:heavy-metal-associated domain-containing protein n=1 Tax=Flavobacterium sp. TaxID=239 RepID=UPI0040496E24
MKKLNKIAVIAMLTLTFMSCKNEAVEVKEEAPVEITKDTIAVADLKTTSLSIEGMTCQMGCANAIESKLTGTEGVQEAKVDFENKLATISFDGTKQTPESLSKIVEAVAGGETYKVSSIN